jgi:hypothetical protein
LGGFDEEARAAMHDRRNDNSEVTAIRSEYIHAVTVSGTTLNWPHRASQQQGQLGCRMAAKRLESRTWARVQLAKPAGRKAPDMRIAIHRNETPLADRTLARMSRLIRAALRCESYLEPRGATSEQATVPRCTATALAASFRSPCDRGDDDRGSEASDNGYGVHGMYSTTATKMPSGNNVAEVIPFCRPDRVIHNLLCTTGVAARVARTNCQAQTTLICSFSHLATRLNK